MDADPLAGEPVFVYGTLKRGHRNHHWLAGASFLGERQLGGAQLFDLGPFPMAVAGAGASATPAASAAAAGEATAGEAGNTTTWIHGELYRVSAEGLDQLDLLEGCPRLYGRHWLQLLDGSHAWVYLGRPRQVRHARLLADGLWRLH
ncbi:gamma-glutamylcyclotransferase [Vulcanococcus limneticus]|uniref:gamma-glutamylcyclotransferase family protein n=1 Tax=Vulcanococcus limneticus TaxID=2170428 RepID=UPI00398BDC30